jgi:hypothetical protein
MNFDRASGIADAVLMEGYALFPYRASALKNRFRWTFGVLAPRAWSEAGGSESWWIEAQLLVAGTPARIAGRLRFFQIEKREGWDDGTLRVVDFDATARETTFAFGSLAGQIAIRRVAVSASPALTKLVIRVENLTRWHDPIAGRDAVLAAALASTHLLIGVEGGELLSLADPPAWARVHAAACTSVGTYPVLIGTAPATLTLSAPFYMQDDPRIAPESAGDTCDGSEIDELLMLCTRSLTDDEKREARATDHRTAEIIERADSLSDARLARMHGASRAVAAGEMVPIGVSTEPRLEPGTKVRVHPVGRTDAQDLLYAEHVATVREVREDIDGTTFYAVTIDDDPAAELHAWYGRYQYYRRVELEVL